MTCKICNSEYRQAVDSDVVNGIAYRKIAKKYDLPYNAVYRHAQNHIPEALQKAADEQEREHARDLFKEIEKVLNDAREIYEDAKSENNNVHALRALAEIRSSLELLSKMRWAIHQNQPNEPEEVPEPVELENGESFQEGIDDILNNSEKHMYTALLEKIVSGDRHKEVIPPEPDFENDSLPESEGNAKRVNQPDYENNPSEGYLKNETPEPDRPKPIRGKKIPGTGD